MMDPFRPPNNQGFDGYGGQQRMGMNDMSGGGGMGPGGMMHPNSNMMQNSQAPYGGGYDAEQLDATKHKRDA